MPQGGKSAFIQSDVGIVGIGSRKNMLKPEGVTSLPSGGKNKINVAWSHRTPETACVCVCVCVCVSCC